MKRTVLLLLSCLALAGCNFRGADGLCADGISRQLAEFRKANYLSVTYDLQFRIPECRDSAVYAHETIGLELTEQSAIIIDFSEPSLIAGEVRINGKPAEAEFVANHIVIDARRTAPGRNEVDFEFVAGEQSLNRRDKFLYTLLVPARAHTLFPCFDQPDMKAEYRLSLEVPQGWSAVSNTSVLRSEGGKVDFAPTEPLSTYLFAFVAGEFQSYTGSRGGRSVTLYHRETDPSKVAQCPEILDLVFNSLDYLEEYTAMPYPFGKYDLIAIPDFQYGGMEHTGATLYNDRKLFLGAAPTTAELLDRASLIAHETAHMWFGDCVTMKWFDDVWTKEVFANWFAAQMARPEFPQINHTLGDLKNYFASAYDEDRTAGSNAIQRPLDNLSNAGLIYCNIIYDKAPVAMDKLAQKMGSEQFQAGIRDYLREFAYSNADWDDLIGVLGRYAGFDIEPWSRVWIKEKGMPVYKFALAGKEITVSQEDPFGRGNVWPQELNCLLIGRDGEMEEVCATFADNTSWIAEVQFEPEVCIPNTDGRAYGCFMLDEASLEYVYRGWADQDDIARMSLLMTIYENVLRKTADASEFVRWAGKHVATEPNPLILGSLLAYTKVAVQICEAADAADYCRALRRVAGDKVADKERRLLCFRNLYGIQSDPALTSELYGIWNSREPYPGLALDETDYTNLAYQLMIRMPEQASSIRSTQASRITNPDRLETFMFVSRAASGDASERRAVFESFSEFSNRRPESRALAALRLLCHPLREAEAVSYIREGLELLPEIQRTGDIFFPASWSKALLESQWSPAAASEVSAFLKDHPETNPLLVTKILQAAR